MYCNREFSLWSCIDEYGGHGDHDGMLNGHRHSELDNPMAAAAGGASVEKRPHSLDTR